MTTQTQTLAESQASAAAKARREMVAKLRAAADAIEGTPDFVVPEYVYASKYRTTIELPWTTLERLFSKAIYRRHSNREVMTAQSQGFEWEAARSLASEEIQPREIELLGHVQESADVA